jgi:hypothetical protein
MIFGGKLDGGAGHSMSACRGYGTVGAESVRTRSIEICRSVPIKHQMWPE